jgi:uncharacterized protein involved in response to NO
MSTFNDPNQQSKENYFLSQPHQPFFIAGVFWAVISMLIFGIAYKLLFKGSDILSISPSIFHTYSLLYMVFTQFFIGFLYTTFTKFCQTDPVGKSYYLITFLLFQSGALLFTLGAFIGQPLLVVGMVLLFLGMASFTWKLFTIYQISTAPLKEDQLWILIAIIIGLVMQGVAIAELLLFHSQYAYKIAFTLYATFLTFVVAQRMVPFFSHSMVKKRAYFLPIVFVALTLSVIGELIHLPILSAIVSLVLSIFLAFEFKRWNFNIKESPAILQILQIALFWFALALFLGSLSTLAEITLQRSFYYAQTHLIALGFITTILIGFGTRVTLGHSGQPPLADAITLKIFYLTQIVVVTRFLFSIIYGSNPDFFWLFDVSLATWLLLFIFWSAKFSRVLLFGKPNKK